MFNLHVLTALPEQAWAHCLLLKMCTRAHTVLTKPVGSTDFLPEESDLHTLSVKSDLDGLKQPVPTTVVLLASLYALCTDELTMFRVHKTGIKAKRNEHIAPTENTELGVVTGSCSF